MKLINMGNSLNIIGKLFKKRKFPIILQAEVTECGHACLTMVLQYHGSNTSLSAIRRAFPTSLKGISLNYLIDMVKYFNLDHQVLRIELEHLKTLNFPTILHWDMNHFVVLKKVRKNKVTIVDPAKGERVLTFDDVSNHFTGIALDIKKTSHPIKQISKKEKKLKLSHLLKNVDGFKKEIIKIVALAFLLQFMAIIGPKYMQLVIDKVVLKNNLQLLYLLLISFLGLKVLETLVTTIRSLVISRFGITINFHLGTRIFSHLLKLPFDYFEKRHLGDIVSRFGSIEQIRQIVTQGLVEGAIDGVMASLTLIMMFLYNVKLAAIVLVAVMLHSIIRFSLFKKSKEKNETMLNLQSIQSSSFMESVRGHKLWSHLFFSSA